MRSRMSIGVWLCGLLFCAEAAVGAPVGRLVHVMVALCDNESQGIVPVPERLGRGDDPGNNLYWGAAYGLRTWFSRSRDWERLELVAAPREPILERAIFRHRASGVLLVADAYHGAEMRRALTDLFAAAAGTHRESVQVGERAVELGAGAALLAFVGHNGLMDFELQPPTHSVGPSRPVIVLSCASRSWFEPHLRAAGAWPLLWTTGLMAPEAYTLEAAVEGWIAGEDGAAVRERAARAYARYQKCSEAAARRLFRSGW